MSDENFDLRKTTAWMQSIVRGQAEVDQYEKGHPGEIEAELTASKTLSAVERLAIYNRAYHFRLLECLRVQYPCLLYFLEDGLFNAFASDYLETYPSTSYTLNLLGADFPEYLASTRLDKDAAPRERESWPDFIIELATLERAFYEVYDGPGVEGKKLLTPDDLAELESNQHLLLEPVICLRLFAFHYPVNRYFREVRSKREPQIPSPSDSYLVVTRRAFIVRIHELNREQFGLLQALASKAPLEKAIKGCGLEVEQACSWVRQWGMYGFFEMPDQ